MRKGRRDTEGESHDGGNNTHSREWPKRTDKSETEMDREIGGGNISIIQEST